MNNELLNNMFLTYNYAKNTQKVYKTSLKQYCEYFDMSLQELLLEAEEEEKKRIDWKYSSLKMKLMEYRQHLINKYAYGTAKAKMKNIMKFYRFYEIVVPALPAVNEKSIKKTPPIYYKDLPDKEILREAIRVSNTRMAAIITFMCSSGSAIAETLGLTIQDYIDSLSEYLPKHEMDINEVIDYISDNDNIVPTFNIRRRKTNKFYTTYCSPEAVKAINAYLVTRTDKISPESKLFKVKYTTVAESFQKINKQLGLGKIGHYNRFRSHMLRKFHASALYNDGMSRDDVNDLQGKPKNQTDETYFMTNPDDLKYEYIKHLPAVTINKDVEKISIKSPEVMQIENENKDLKTELSSIKAEMSDLEGIKSEIADLKNLKEEILSLKNLALNEE